MSRRRTRIRTRMMRRRTSTRTRGRTTTTTATFSSAEELWQFRMLMGMRIDNRNSRSMFYVSCY
eukprot:2871672-Pyramimonas_sp.AAC.2